MTDRFSWLTLLTCGLVLVSLGMQVMILWPRLVPDAEPEEPEMMTFVFGDTTAPDPLTSEDLAHVAMALARPCRLTAVRLWTDGTIGPSAVRFDTPPRQVLPLLPGHAWQVVPLLALPRDTRVILGIAQPAGVRQVRLSLACGISPGTRL